MVVVLIRWWWLDFDPDDNVVPGDDDDGGDGDGLCDCHGDGPACVSAMIPAKCKEARAQICQGFRSLQADEEIYPTLH